MTRVEEYITVGTKRLRCGCTTGTCAAAATRAAATMACGNPCPAAVAVETPAGITVTADIEDIAQGPGWAQCAVRKDAGDDPDITNGTLVYAHAQRTPEAGIAIDGGAGVGRVTRAGLDQPVGAAAINRVPRQMIAREAQAALEEAQVQGGLQVTISIPEGEALARRTFNPRLGIEGGISVLGTSGIVRPMSEDALISSIHLEMNVLASAGCRHLLVSPGNYGKDFAREVLHLDLDHAVQCSNYLGATLDEAVRLGFESVLVVGHIGKMAKASAGIMNTHSRTADARGEIMAAHAALAGADRTMVGRIMESVTTDEALQMLREAGLDAQVIATMMARLKDKLDHRTGGATNVQAVMFSNEFGLLGETSGAEELVTLHANTARDEQ